MDVLDSGRLTVKRNTLKINELYPEDIFSLFSDATDCAEILYWFKKLLFSLSIKENEDHTQFYYRLKDNLKSWRCQSLWDLIDARAKHKEYEKGKVCSNVRVLIIGAGPIGLRTAIESALLGCHTVIVERRDSFTRNNVLHLWPFLMADFRALGAKKFYGKFGSGSIDHISIRTLQCILLKLCLILGVQVFTKIDFKHLIEPANGSSWKASYSPSDHLLHDYEFDVVIGADGKKNILPGFQQIEMRGALAIGITCNFVNNNTQEEAHAKEICGIAYQFHQEFFDKLEEIHGIKLENIVYYKDETHYFVMTISKSSLLGKGVLKRDYTEPAQLLSRNNIDKDKLLETTLVAVNYATNNQLPTLELAKNPDGSPDIACFDFTSIKKAANSSRILERSGKKLLMALVGDSALEPFWPTGSGCGRGVLSALDTAWMIRGFGINTPPMYLLRERENIFKLLSGVTNSDLQKTYNTFTINPKTRYSNLNTKLNMNIDALKKLYDTDNQQAVYDLSSPTSTNADFSKVFVKPTRQRRKSGGRRLSLGKKSKRKSDRTELREAQHVSNTKKVWQDKATPEEDQLPNKKRRPSLGSSTSSLESINEAAKQRNVNASASGDEKTTPRPRPVKERTFSFGDSIDELMSSNEHNEDINGGGGGGDFNFHLQSEQQKRKPRKSITYMTFLDEDDLNKEEDKLQNNLDMNMGEKLEKILKKRESMNEKGKEKVAARKSVARAKRRLNKLGQSQSSDSDQENKENSALPPIQPKVEKKRYNKETFARTISLTNGKRKANESQKTAKELIAEAEGRFIELPKDVSAPRNNNLQKRKLPESNGKYKPLEEPHEDKGADVLRGRDISGVTVRRKHKSNKNDNPMFDNGAPTSDENKLYAHNAAIVHALTPQRSIDGSNKKEHASAVQYTAGIAALALMACPLLMKCKRPANLSLSSSNSLYLKEAAEKKETKELSFKRAGSVRKAIEQYKTKLAKDETDKGALGSYHKRKTSTTALITEFDEMDNIDASYGPKEIVDLERAFLSEELLPTSKKSFGKHEPPVGILLRLAVLELLNETTHTVAFTALQLLINIHREILKHLNEDKYYRVSLKNPGIEKHLWNVIAARKFLRYLGWSQCGQFLLLSKSTNVQECCMVLEEGIRLCEKSQMTGMRAKSRSTVAVGKAPSFRDQFARPVSPVLTRRQRAALGGGLGSAVSTPNLPTIDITKDADTHANTDDVMMNNAHGMNQLSPAGNLSSLTPGLGDSYVNISSIIDGLEGTSVDDQMMKRSASPASPDESYLVVDLREDFV